MILFPAGFFATCIYAAITLAALGCVSLAIFVVRDARKGRLW